MLNRHTPLTNTAVTPFGPYTAHAELTRPLVAFAHKGQDWIRGSEQCLLDLVSGVDRSLFRLLVLTNGRTLANEVEKRGVEAVIIKHWSGGALLNAPSRLRVTRLLRERSASVVHANMAVTLPLVVPAARRLGIPVLTHLHTPFTSLSERHAALVRQTALTVGVAEHVVAPLRAGMFTPARVRVVDNAVNVERLAGGDASGMRAELGIAPGAFVAASIGSLIARKSQHTAVRAISAARAEGIDMHLILCGDGPDEPALRELAASLGVGDAVHLLGARRDVGPILRNTADVLVTCALEEAQPLSVLEAQWVGVPVAASDIVAHREALPPAAGGVLFPLGDAHALAVALTALARDPARRASMRAAGQAFARERYDMRRYVRQFEVLYGELISTAASAAARDRSPAAPRPDPRAAWRTVLRTS
jgi:glycosyltransferase involved in cell wall biosynthesis